VDHYVSLGDAKLGLNPVQNSMRKVANRVIDFPKPEPRELEALKWVFQSELAVITDDGRVIRRRAERTRIPKDADRLINSLVKARVLMITESGSETYVEVAHEALLRNWEIAKKWLDEDREFISWRRRITNESAVWKNAADSQKSGTVLTGVRLSEAVYWLERKRSQIDKDSIQYIQVSGALDKRVRRDRHKQRIYANIWMSIAGVCIVAVAFLWYLRR
jgi:hypothetical protein